MSEWEDIERLLKQDAEKLNFEFQEEYWDEVAAELDVQDAMEAGLESLGASPFQFQEEYWDEMSAMLDESERKKRRGIFFYMASGAAALLLLFSTVFHSDEPVSQKVDYAQTLQKETQKTVDNTKVPTSTVVANDLDDKENKEVGQTGDNKVIPTNTKPSQTHQYRSITPVNTIDQGSVSDEDSQTPILTETNSRTPQMLEGPQEKHELPSILVDPTKHTLETIAPIATHMRSGIDRRTQQSTPVSDALIKSKPKRSRLFLTSGLLSAYAPEGNSENSAALGMGGYAGLGYALHMKRMEFRVGLNFGYRTGINHELVYNRRYYGTQLFEETDEVTYKGLSRLELPLELCYSRGRNTFGLGVTPVWNAGVNSTYHKYNSYSDEELLVHNNFGIREGVNDFDVRLSLNYEKRLSPRFTMGGRASFGLFNQVDTDVFTESNGFREMSGALYIKYNILAF